MIKGIVIPADNDVPASLRDIDTSSIKDYNDIVGGNFEIVEFMRPAASLFLNEEGKLMNLPLNQRATSLVWAHNPPFRGADVIVGDTVIVGPPDEEGETLTVPDELVQLLMHTETYRVEFQRPGSQNWHVDQTVFDNWYYAYVYAVDSATLFPSIGNVRVVAAT